VENRAAPNFFASANQPNSMAGIERFIFLIG